MYKRPKQSAVYFKPHELRKVQAAAARSGLSVSKFCVRAALSEAGELDMTARILQAPALRGAIADVMSRPSVVGELAERLKVSSPKQLKLFRDELHRSLGIVSGAKG